MAQPGVLLGAQQGQGDISPTPFLWVLLFLGRLGGKGKAERALAGGMIHSHAAVRRSRSGLAGAWEGNQEGQGCPGHGPALWPHGPIPRAAGESRGEPAAPEGLVGPAGWARGVGGILGAFGLCWVFMWGRGN